MRTRMQPIASVWNKLPRVVRDLSLACGKQVELELEGKETELDRTVIEAIKDPLVHIVRNSIDHGIETAETRIAAGKPATGRLHLRAFHEGGQVNIEINDDGAGIDPEKVRRKAIERGVITAERATHMGDREVLRLIFMPGFSTAEKVTNVSGRGVGMDVVKRSIQALGGRISIASRPGYGSTFTMSLPLTLAVLDGMVVKVADQTLVIPLTTILETLKPKLSDIYGLGPDAQVMGIRGGFTPLIDVARELGFRSTRSDPLNGVTLLIETEGGVRSALLVDAIQDQRQVVIKSLEANYGHVEGIAAATILGDGRIALILDADAIVNSSTRNAMSSEPLYAAAG
jgi:two-component system chemotaxis sensor kinase CheA